MSLPAPVWGSWRQPARRGSEVVVRAGLPSSRREATPFLAALRKGPAGHAEALAVLQAMAPLAIDAELRALQVRHVSWLLVC